MSATPLALLREVRSDDEVEALRAAALDAEIERGVAERTAALEATAAELETFTHAAAHELRAPLRAIGGFADALIEDHADALPA